MTLQITGKNNGGGYWVHCTDEGKPLMGIVPDELLDDEVGDNTSEQERKDWIQSNAAEIEKALIAQHRGGFVNARFNRIRLAANL